MTPKEECEVLLNSILPMAEKLLEKNGEFYPVGAVLKSDDTVSMTAAFDGNEFPDSKVVIGGLVDIHRKLAIKDEIKVSGIAWNGSVQVGRKTKDAIIVSLEHKDGYSVVIGEPYQIGIFKKIKFGELFALPGKNDVFHAE